MAGVVQRIRKHKHMDILTNRMLSENNVSPCRHETNVNSLERVSDISECLLSLL